jgi:hypothetical protein
VIVVNDQDRLVGRHYAPPPGRSTFFSTISITRDATWDKRMDVACPGRNREIHIRLNFFAASPSGSTVNSLNSRDPHP